MNPHILYYNKSNEGAQYADNSNCTERGDDAILPGGSYVYRWSVPEFVGPKDDDTDCVTSYYSSAVNPIEDTQSGRLKAGMTLAADYITGYARPGDLRFPNSNDVTTKLK